MLIAEPIKSKRTCDVTNTQRHLLVGSGSTVPKLSKGGPQVINIVKRHFFYNNVFTIGLMDDVSYRTI